MWRQAHEHEAPLWHDFAGTGPSLPLGCFSGLKLVVVFELSGIFNGKLYALCIQINSFQYEGQA